MELVEYFKIIVLITNNQLFKNNFTSRIDVTAGTEAET